MILQSKEAGKETKPWSIICQKYNSKPSNLCKNSHAGLQMVPHEHCTDWAGQGCSQFYTRRIQRNFLIQLSGCVKIARVPCREISHLYAAQAARLRWNFPHKMPSHPSPHSGIRASSLDFYNMEIKPLFVFWQHLQQYAQAIWKGDNPGSLNSNVTVLLWQPLQPVQPPWMGTNEFFGRKSARRCKFAHNWCQREGSDAKRRCFTISFTAGRLLFVSDGCLTVLMESP